VHEAIDYRAKDWVVELDRLTNGKGVALITDPLGGNHWKKSYKALRSTGRLGMFGVSVATTSKLPGPLRLLPLALGTPFFHPLALMNANKSVFGVNLGHMWHESDMIAGWMEILLKGVADDWVRPHVDKSFPLAQAGEAQTCIEERWMLSLRRCTLSGITFP
jgi:NADPH:quinone reductase-like Zn-dependent oxidoreductase